MNGELPMEEPVEDATFVRPFIITGGRAEPLQADLRLETLVVAVGVPDETLTFERRHIVAVCERPTTVAEVASRVGPPQEEVEATLRALEAQELVQITNV